jgi:hypothetical protein
MAASPVSSRFPTEIVQAVETIVTTCASTPIETLFGRAIEIPDEQRIKRNIAFALLTGAGFESSSEPKMGKFGGFATDSCRQAILTLKTFYRDHGGDPQDYMLRRRDLYKIFKQKLDAKFGKEHTDIIPASLAVKQVKLMRKSLFYSGYSLSMTHILNEKPLPPTPFYSVVTPMMQKQENRTVSLPNHWLTLSGTYLSPELKQIFFNEIYETFIRQTSLVFERAECRCRCPSSIGDLIGLFFCRIPVRLRTLSGHTREGYVIPLPHQD